MRIPIVFSEKYAAEDRDHVFRAGKFASTLKILLKKRIIAPADIVEPDRPTKADLLLAHTPAWVKKILSGGLTPSDAARAELNGTAEVVEAHLMNAGGTILAARLALETGLGVNCGGGAHHAFSDHGEGFCLVNDIAMAVNSLRSEKRIKRALVIDLDVHQGNGTAAIFGGDRDVFTFSIHQKGIYPEVRERGSLDLELPAGAGNKTYLALLKSHLPVVFRRAQPDLVVYNAGVDVYEKDLLGGLKLTMAGVRRRDEMVFRKCFELPVPVVLVLSGGYAARSGDTARLHAGTIEAALRLKG